MTAEQDELFTNSDEQTNGEKRVETIRRILDEVQDPTLRDSLLRELVAVDRSGEYLYSTLKSLGLNPTGVQSFVGFQLRLGVLVHFGLGALFIIMGLAKVLEEYGRGASLSFEGKIHAAFIAGGCLAIVQGYQLARALNKG